MIDFRKVDRHTADEMFTAMPKESKWAEVTGTLLAGTPVFIPYMTRNQLETLRTIVGNRRMGVLRSRSTEMDGVPGRLLRIVRMEASRKSHG